MGFLTGKTAIITGGGRAVLSDGSCGSIGYGIATAYAKEGANLVITGRNVKKLEDAKEELERLYGIKGGKIPFDPNILSIYNIYNSALQIHAAILLPPFLPLATIYGVSFSERINSLDWTTFTNPTGTPMMSSGVNLPSWISS